MKCVKMPVNARYITCLVFSRQGDREINFIYGRKRKNAVSSLLKKP
jgi:hypothetical protein